MNASRAFWWAVALIAVAAAIWYRTTVFSEPPTPAVRIVVVTGGSGPYWQIIAQGARAAADEHRVNLELEMPADDESLAQQTKLLEGLDLARFDGVAVSPLDGAGQTPLIDGIAKKSYVVTFDSDAPDSARLSYIGTSNLQAGRKAARLVQEAIPAGGKVAVVFANLTKDNMRERRAGFDEILAQLAAARAADATIPEYDVVEYLVDDGSSDRCRELLAQALDDHADLACLVGMNAQHGAILLDVLTAKEKLGKVAVVAFDEEKATLDGVESGSIYATVVQDPYRYGYETVRTLAAMCRGDDRQRPLKGSFSTLSIATMAVTKDTVDEFRKELEERTSSARGGAEL